MEVPLSRAMIGCTAAFVRTVPAGGARARGGGEFRGPGKAESGVLQLNLLAHRHLDSLRAESEATLPRWLASHSPEPGTSACAAAVPGERSLSASCGLAHGVRYVSGPVIAA